MDKEKREEIFIEEVEKAKELAFELNTFLLENPEISGEEYKSAGQIVKLLRAEGMEVEASFAGFDTAFKGIVNKREGAEHSIAILCEYDALEEIGHACGHSASGSLSVLAAVALFRHRELLSCNVDIIGTPDEEINGAKIAMIEKGVFDGYSLVMMIHMDTANKIKMDFKAMDTYRFSFKGKPAHASSNPWEGRSALNGVMLMIHAFDMMRQHLHPATRIHGIIKEGGLQDNVIPEESVAEYSFRSDDKDYLEKVVAWGMDAAKGAALATGTQVDIQRRGPVYYNMKQNKTGNALVREIYEELGLYMDPLRTESIGSSDMGNVSYVCPALHPTIALGTDYVPHHTREFEKLLHTDAAKEAILQGGKAIVLTILRATEDPERMASIRRDFLKHEKDGRNISES